MSGKSVNKSKSFSRKLQESVGLFHVQQEMPEQPSRGLFKSLFSSAAAVDREELCKFTYRDNYACNHAQRCIKDFFMEDD